ncbi:hypothetical protein Tco_1336243 [Tanacetum coccineum]
MLVGYEWLKVYLYEALQKSLDAPRSPLGSPPSQPPPPPPPAGASGAPGTSGASGSSQLPPPLPPPSTSTSGSTPQQGSEVPRAQELSPSDDLMHDDSAPDEQVHVSDDQDFGDDHTPTSTYSRKDWWKPLPEEERPSTPEPAWTILPSNVSDVENNWASTLASSYACKDWRHDDFLELANPEGDQVRINVNRPLPLGGPPGHVTIQTEFFFNKDLEYLRYGSKGSSPALLISKMKATSYPDFGLELLVPEQMWIDDVCTYDMQLNLTKPGWDATDYEFKHDYTIIESPRAVIFPINNNERKIMRFNEIYKFNDGTLIHILETLDYRVMEFKIKRLNPGMNTYFWTKKGVTRRKEFITEIERQLKIRRIYRNLECFVGGRVRDIDYRLH